MEDDIWTLQEQEEQDFLRNEGIEAFWDSIENHNCGDMFLATAIQESKTKDVNATRKMS